MSVTETIAPPAVDTEALARLGESLRATTGLCLLFYGPDGTGPVAGAAGGSAKPEGGEDLDALARRAAETQEDCLQEGPDGLLAAWPIRLRTRVILVAAAALPAPEARGGGALAAAVGEAVRAHVALQAARRESDALSEALARSFEEVSLLHALGEVLCVAQPLPALVERACRELRETLGVEAVAACLPAVQGLGPLTVVAGRLPFAASSLAALLKHVLGGPAAGPAGQTPSGKQGVVINNRCQGDPEVTAVSVALERLLAVPLELREASGGALVAVNRQEGDLGSADAKLVRSVASSIAIFVENHRLYHDLQELMLELVRALVSSIDAKDPYTCGHSERVAITCREIARRLALPDHEVEWAYLAGLLHDIGKIGTPEHILRKEGRLEPEERKIINEHPVIGGRILEGIKRLQPIHEAVLHHHERPDGAGYPEGLQGEAIPPLARIVGMADAFDAMTSNRPYRPMLPLEHVLREIERNVGRQFDAAVVDALLSINLEQLMQKYVNRPTTLRAPLGHR